LPLLHLICVAAAILFCSPGARAAGEPVDLVLVLAVDVSGSITDERFRIQMRGYADAFRAPEVIAAIQSGPAQAISVTLVEWAGPAHQSQVLEWTRLDGEASARRFASALSETPRAFASQTAIGSAIEFCTRILDKVDPGTRRVIDISGDGSNNTGPEPDGVRDGAVAQGIIINGLPIEGSEDNVAAYYRAHVIGGHGSFIVVVRDIDGFTRALIKKLVLEISGRTAAHDPPS
jgi:hypothetical protein